MDDADLTQARLEAEEALRARYSKPTAPAMRYAHCLDCGEPIPEARRQAVPGVQTCIECQTLIERAGLRVFPERNA